MQRQKFGSTSLLTTKIGYGLAAIGRPAYINLGHDSDLRKRDVDSMRKQAFTNLDVAWEGGIRYFDVARSYGLAEEFLAEWLDERQISPDDVTVGSKWGYTYVGDWQVDTDVHEVKEHCYEVLMRQWAESQFNLGRFINIYHIHSATQSSRVLQNAEVLDALWEIRQYGTTVGLSVSGTDQADTLWQALEIQRDGEHLFGSVQATWNVLERSATDALVAAHEAGWGVIVKEAVANGRLTNRNAKNRAFSDTYSTVKSQAERLKTGVDAIAIRFVMEQPWADVVLSGATRYRHLSANLEAVEITWDNMANEVLSELTEDPKTYWQTRAELDWK